MSRQPADAGSVYLHIGEPKSGTTYLQQVLWANRAALREHGLLLPGRPDDHWQAAEDLRQVEHAAGDPFAGAQSYRYWPVGGAWDRLAAQARRAPHSAVISHELLAAADADQAARGVRALGAADVHVILTVRDIATLLPAEWQESVKHRNTRAWRDWLSDVIDRESGAADRRRWWFWRVHDTLEILRAWSAAVPAEHIHVITVPPRGAGRHLLWTRFAQVVGVPADSAEPGRARSNASLGLAEIEFLRRLNAAVPPSLPDWFYWRTVKDGLAHEALATTPVSPDERLALPAERDEWARAHAETLVAGLQAAGYDVVGDLAELLPQAPPTHRGAPADATDTQLLAASVTAAVHLVTELAAAEGVPLATGGAAGPAPHGPLKRGLIELSRRNRAVHRLRRGYWHVANAVRATRRASRWRSVDDRNIS
jgi:hypothetical protein